MVILREITDETFFIPNPVNIGVVKTGKSVILIDTGLDRNTGKKVLKLLEGNGLSVKTIINTHSHADHCGGNNYIKDKTGATIHAPELESAIIQYPFLEPLYLFSGASPLKDLKNKFLMAQPSVVDRVIKKDERKLEFDEIEIELNLLPLPGHAPNQIGIEVDEVLFCADSVFSEEVLAKHKIPFNVDIDDQKETLKFLKNTSHRFYVPCHAEPRDNISGLVDANLKVLNRVEEYLLDRLQTRKTTEQVLKETCDHHQIHLNGPQQYYLMNATIMAYLSSLHDRGLLAVDVKDNALSWQKTGI
ncbi:MAG: MBL fold metallo-hydrolase [Candidatus Hodarchaeales archaeon]|jgi:glyoxylase-like metal-dependent hydrolase (beta-lactamase superfamily II)